MKTNRVGNTSRQPDRMMVLSEEERAGNTQQETSAGYSVQGVFETSCNFDKQTVFMVCVICVT
jgi:hypothetical protein